MNKLNGDLYPAKSKLPKELCFLNGVTYQKDHSTLIKIQLINFEDHSSSIKTSTTNSN